MLCVLSVCVCVDGGPEDTHTLRFKGGGLEQLGLSLFNAIIRQEWSKYFLGFTVVSLRCENTTPNDTSFSDVSLE